MDETNKKVVSLAAYRQQTRAKQTEDGGMMTPPSLQISQALEDLLSDAEKAPLVQKRPARKRTARVAQTISGNNNVQAMGKRVASQSIQGDGNLQVAGDLNLNLRLQATSLSAIRVEPAPGTVGANGGLRLRINALVKEIERNRLAHHGQDFRYGSVQGIIAKALGLKKDEWTLMWGWDESRAPEIIEKLEQARDNTIQGRNNKAARKPGYRHTRGHLFQLEKEYLKQLGWSDDKARSKRLLITGEASRADMPHDLFSNWVSHLYAELRRIYGEI